MVNGRIEGLVASHLSDASDPSLLTSKEVKDGWGSWENFMLSFGLKPHNSEDFDTALEISRKLKGGRTFQAESD